MRPLKFHCTRHTWASMALASGKSVRWVVEQLGHSSPMLTLKTYAHAIREEEMDLSFAEFEVRDGSERLYPAPSSSTDVEHENAPDLAAEDVHFIWSTRPDLNRRPSRWQENSTPRKISNLRSSDRHIAAYRGK